MSAEEILAWTVLGTILTAVVPVVVGLVSRKFNKLHATIIPGAFSLPPLIAREMEKYRFSAETGGVTLTDEFRDLLWSLPKVNALYVVDLQAKGNKACEGVTIESKNGVVYATVQRSDGTLRGFSDAKSIEIGRMQPGERVEVRIWEAFWGPEYQKADIKRRFQIRHDDSSKYYLVVPHTYNRRWHILVPRIVVIAILFFVPLWIIVFWTVSSALDAR